MTEQPNRVQGGRPDGGQFATGPRAEPTVSLEVPDSTAPRPLADLDLPHLGSVIITDAETGDTTFPQILLSRHGEGFSVTGCVPVDQDVIDRHGGPENFSDRMASQYGARLGDDGDGEPVVEFTAVLDEDAKEDEVLTNLHERTRADAFISARDTDALG